MKLVRDDVVRGPVAMITESQELHGISFTSSRSIVISELSEIADSTSLEKFSRSTASAPPAGTLCYSPHFRISELHRRISSCSRPTALFSLSSDRNELEHTSSARWPV